MVGGVSSITLSVVVQVLLLPARSVTITVMLCGPVPTSVPGVGLCVMVNEATGVKLSEAVTLPTTFGIAAWQFALADAVVAAGQVTVGCVRSILTVRLASALMLPALSM